METQETPFYIYDSYVDPSEDLVNLDVNEGTDYDPSKLYTESVVSDPYVNRQYLIVNTSDVVDTDLNGRKSNDGTKMVIKYQGDMPESLSSLTDVEGPYSREEIKPIMLTTDWVEVMEEN